MRSSKFASGSVACLALLIMVGYIAGFRIVRIDSKPTNAAKPNLELIVGGTTPYWQSVILGARQAADTHSANLEVRVPATDGRDQTRHLLMIAPQRVDGIAISPLFPDEQTRILSALATEMNVVTYGNDVPNSLRQYYIGTDNHGAGKLIAKLVKEALAEGGEVAVFIGDGHRDVARLRLHAFYNELLETEAGTDALSDPISKSGKNDKYHIVETYFDERDKVKAEANAKQAIADFPKLKCMVGLYGYNSPACLKALKAADKSDEIKVVAFDAYEATLNGIEAGTVFASVVQDSFKYGYESIRILAAMHRGEIEKTHPIAQRSTQTMSCSAIKKDNLPEYRKEMSDRMKQMDKQKDNSKSP